MSSPEKVRVRFAPSPTGYLHVGGARTVLYNWLYARHTNGTFVLRIEDTDQERSTAEAERMQIEDIISLKLLFDEGPGVGGPHPPYRQSERIDIYKKYSNELIESEKAYYCFCSDEILDQKRETAMKLGMVPQYDGTCRKQSKAESYERIKKGEKPTVRFKAIVREYRLQDAVRGEVVFQPNMVGDFVLLRSGGMPVYNFCCVVDDHLMGITHVLRAEEHLSNTVRQMMLYETFGWKMPVMAHCSLILGSDRTKLSKRHGATSVHQYLEEGFLPEALINFLVLLGWSSPEGKEILTIDEMVSQFTLDRLNKAPCVFDPVKLKWMNGQYIKSLPLSDITSRAIPFIEKEGIQASKLNRVWLEKAFDIIRTGLETLEQSAAALGIFFKDDFGLEEEARKVKADPLFENVVETLKASLKAHIEQNGDTINDVQFQGIQDSVKTITGAKGKSLFMPMRVALSEQTHGPELKLIVPLLGAKRALARIDHAIRA